MSALRLAAVSAMIAALGACRQSSVPPTPATDAAPTPATDAAPISTTIDSGAVALPPGDGGALGLCEVRVPSLDYGALIPLEGTTVFVARIEKREEGPLPTPDAYQGPVTFVTSVTTVLQGDRVRVGQIIRTPGGGNGLRALRHLDDRSTPVSSDLLFACGDTGTAVNNAHESLRRGVDGCVEMQKPGPSRAMKVAAGYMMRGARDNHDSGVLQSCATTTMCKRLDRLETIETIARVAEVYDQIIWDLLDGLRPKGEDRRRYVDALGCPDPPVLVDPAKGADEANVTALETLLAYNVRSLQKMKGVAWFVDAQKIIASLDPPAQKAALEKIPAARKSAAVKAIDALPAEDKARVATLRAALSTP